MIEITGDLFAHGEQGPDAICITTNGFISTKGANTMGRGCAAEAKRRWPGIQMVVARRIKEYGNTCQVLTHYGPDRMPVLSVPDKWRPCHLGLPYHLIMFPVKPTGDVALPDKSNVVKHMRDRTPIGGHVLGWACVARPKLIEKSAQELVTLTDKHRFNSVVLPRPGCGAGELSWGEIRPMLQQILDDRFYIITFK